MAATLVLHLEVADFDTWKGVFDEVRSLREKHGCRGHRVARDGNAVTVVLDYPDREAVQAFLGDPALKEAMANAGVQGPPDAHVADQVEVLDY